MEFIEHRLNFHLRKDKDIFMVKFSEYLNKKEDEKMLKEKLKCCPIV